MQERDKKQFETKLVDSFFVSFLIGVDCFIAKCESAVHLNGANYIIHVIDGRWMCFRYGFRENYYRHS